MSWKRLIYIIFCLWIALSCTSRQEIVYKYPPSGNLQRVVTKEGKFGYADANGEMVIDAIYDIAYDFNEGVAIVAVADSKGEPGYMAIAADGTIMHAIALKECILDTGYSNGLLLYKEVATGRFGYMDLSGSTKIYLPKDVVYAESFSNGKARFATLQGEGYIDIRGNIVGTANGMVKEAAKPAQKEYVLKSTLLEDKDLAVLDKNHPLYIEAGKILQGDLAVEDVKSRRLILNYMEHLRVSYITKDIDFIEQLFSNNALIIVGKVVKSSGRQELGMADKAKVQYNLLSKKRYISNLRQVFKSNKEIDVKFSDFKIMRHPTRQGIYGVRLRQAYTSTLYSDDGYLFLLWDFRDEAMPQIHVRTWQESIGPQGLPQDSLYGIRHFNLQ